MHSLLAKCSHTKFSYSLILTDGCWKFPRRNWFNLLLSSSVTIQKWLTMKISTTNSYWVMFREKTILFISFISTAEKTFGLERIQKNYSIELTIIKKKTKPIDIHSFAFRLLLFSFIPFSHSLPSTLVQNIILGETIWIAFFIFWMLVFVCIRPVYAVLMMLWTMQDGISSTMTEI